MKLNLITLNRIIKAIFDNGNISQIKLISIIYFTKAFLLSYNINVIKNKIKIKKDFIEIESNSFEDSNKKDIDKNSVVYGVIKNVCNNVSKFSDKELKEIITMIRTPYAIAMFNNKNKISNKSLKNYFNNILNIIPQYIDAKKRIELTFSILETIYKSFYKNQLLD